MKINRCFLMTVFLLLSACSGKNTSSFTELPIYPKAFSIKHYIDRPVKGAESLTFRVTSPFPAEEITTYIDNEMNVKGFKRPPMPYDALPSFSWSTFNSKTGNWEKTDKAPARYIASWTNENRNEIAWIGIDYAPYAKVKNWQNTAQVSFQITKFSEFKKETEELEKLMHKKTVRRQSSHQLN